MYTTTTRLKLCLLMTVYVARQLTVTEGNDRAGPQLDLKVGAVMGNYEAGETQVMSIRRDSRHPQYGKCWTNALEVVSSGCKRLTDDEQSRMALTLANCHLAKAGFNTYPCDATMGMKDCLHPMKDSSIAFNAYTEFFTHTQDICFFLQSQVWHQHTEETVEKLAQSSEDVADQLEVTSRLQESMIQQQNQSLRNQREILDQEAQLKVALQSSTSSIKEVFDEMRSSTLQQKALFAETFERVTQVQQLMLGEFTWFNSIIYYMVVMLLAYMLTSTPRTAGARFRLFILLVLSWFTEWLLFHITHTNDRTLFHARMWLCRKVFCSIGFFLWVYCACRYRDYNQINHSILLQIQKQLHDGTVQFKTNPQLSSGSDLHPAVQCTNNPALTIASPKAFPAIKSSQAISSSTLDITEFTSDGSDAEITINPENLASSESRDSSSSDRSFLTAEQASRRPSLVGASFNPLTPHSVPSTSHHESGTKEMGSSTKRKRGRPRSSKHMASREGTLVKSTRTPSPYNLRRRAVHQSPNPLLDLETTLMFAQHVEDLASRHYVIQRRLDPSSSGRSSSSAGTAATRPAFFSSDEEM